jgi:hypothetical protein
MNCDFDSLASGKSPKFGNVTPPPNGHYLVCMVALNRTIEVGRSNNIYWDCFTESSRDGKTWMAAPQYRANFESSLYPCYFSVQNMLSSDTIGKNDLAFNFKIVNEGTNADSYHISLKNDRNIVLKKADLENVNSGSTKRVEIKMKEADSKSTNHLVVLVSSANNPKLVRKVIYTIIR